MSIPLRAALPGIRPGGRRSVRLAPSAYAGATVFVTVVTAGRAPCLCRIGPGGRVRLTWLGEIVVDEWAALPTRRPAVHLDAFVVMPDHVHFVIGDGGGGRDGGGRGVVNHAPTDSTPHPPIVPTHPTAPAAGSFAAFVNAWKGGVTRRVNDRRGTPGAPLWHRGFHDHIVRDACDLARIRRYITGNPVAYARTRDGR